MNVEYLYSIVNLYLKKETDKKKTILNIKKNDDSVEFSFSMKNVNEDKTTFVIPYTDFCDNQIDFLKLYKEELMVIDEKYTYHNLDNTSYYILFNSGRVISFDGFSVLEMNNARNILYDIKFNQDEIRLEANEEKEMAYKPRLRLQQAGFSSYATLLLAVITFVAVLFIILLVFKSGMK